MTKRSFVIGYSNLTNEELELLELKFSEIYTFKKIDFKNLISSFLDVDVLITNDKLNPTTKKFLKNICIPIYKTEDYSNDINTMVLLINNELKILKNKSIDYNNALKLLNEAYKKGNLNHHELNHSIRVANEALYFGKKIGFQGNSLKRLFIAGLLHDIGKTCIPKEILTKKSRLNNKEFEVIKAHPIIGSKLVAKDIELIIKEHHERYDGSGYPNHLKGEDITLESRILGVVDSYDAMTTKRSYKEKMNLMTSLQELLLCITPKEKGGKGILYDPILVSKFYKLKLNTIN